MKYISTRFESIEFLFTSNFLPFEPFRSSVPFHSWIKMQIYGIIFVFSFLVKNTNTTLTHIHTWQILSGKSCFLLFFAEIKIMNWMTALVLPTNKKCKVNTFNLAEWVKWCRLNNHHLSHRIPCLFRSISFFFFFDRSLFHLFRFVLFSSAK